MIVNLFSYNTETSTPDEFFSFNQVVAWSLYKAFTKIGVEARFIGNGQFEKEDFPTADHSIAISSFTMKAVKDNPILRQKMRDATRGKMTLYLDSDYMDWWKAFDIIFTVVKPKNKRPEYVYGGWGADPALFYPEQNEKAIFLDSLMYNKYKGLYNNFYDIYKELFDIPDQNLSSGKRYVGTASKVGATIHMPIPTYDKRNFRIYWPQMQEIIRKCHYYCCTQLGESGLTRIEAATSGALLVVPEALYRPRTMDSLECRRWRTRDDLLDILSMNVDLKANREKALKHSWDKVAERMMKVFENKSG